MKPRVWVNKKGFLQLQLVGGQSVNRNELHELATLVRGLSMVKRAYVRDHEIHGRVVMSYKLSSVRRAIHRAATYFCRTNFAKDSAEPSRAGHHCPGPIFTKKQKFYGPMSALT